MAPSPASIAYDPVSFLASGPSSSQPPDPFTCPWCRAITVPWLGHPAGSLCLLTDPPHPSHHICGECKAAATAHGFGALASWLALQVERRRRRDAAIGDATMPREIDLSRDTTEEIALVPTRLRTIRPPSALALYVELHKRGCAVRPLPVVVRHVALKLGLTTQTVYRAARALESIGYLARGQHDGMTVWSLDPAPKGGHA